MSSSTITVGPVGPAVPDPVDAAEVVVVVDGVVCECICDVGSEVVGVIGGGGGAVGVDDKNDWRLMNSVETIASSLVSMEMNDDLICCICCLNVTPMDEWRLDICVWKDVVA